MHAASMFVIIKICYKNCQIIVTECIRIYLTTFVSLNQSQIVLLCVCKVCHLCMKKQEFSNTFCVAYLLETICQHSIFVGLQRNHKKQAACNQLLHRPGSVV